jgi:hypothetical protein
MGKVGKSNVLTTLRRMMARKMTMRKMNYDDYDDGKSDGEEGDEDVFFAFVNIICHARQTPLHKQ